MEINYNVLDFCIIKIEKSNNKLYKYVAVIQSKEQTVNISFGSCSRDGVSFEHYHDRTGLRLYSDFDNYNPIKSRAWYIKYKDKINKQFYSSKMLEYIFLQKS
jgi:hypothetical protein